MPKPIKPLGRIYRMRQALAAMVLAAILGASTLLEPFDRIVWMNQARITDKPVSGEIVFVEVSEDFSDTASPGAKTHIANAVRSAQKAGAKKIFLDIPLQRAEEPADDDALYRALENAGELAAVSRWVDTRTARSAMRGGVNDLSIPKTTHRLVTRRSPDYFGYTWWDRPVSFDGRETHQTLPAAIVGWQTRSREFYAIDATYDAASIPRIAASEIIYDPVYARDSLENKTVVIGPAPTLTSYAKTPGLIFLPPSYIPILSAESLLEGSVPEPPWYNYLVIAALTLVLLIFFARSARQRRIGYVALLLAYTLSMVPLASLAVRANLAAGFTFFAIYFGTRAWLRWKHKRELIDVRTKLPTFHALEAKLRQHSGGAAASCIIVARMHRFDAIVSSLPAEGQAEYINTVAARLSISDQDMDIYSDGGDQLAWEAPHCDNARLVSHLSGLRSICSTPMQIGDNMVDVGVTFGCDNTNEKVPATKIASASSAASETTEAHDPIVFAGEVSSEDRAWNASIQAKIDMALENGDIYVVLQPQMELATGRITGAEALVRWRDEARGEISPGYFIKQCEDAGRMQHITRKVLHDATLAAKRISAQSYDFDLSVNISATLFRGDILCSLVDEVLATTGFDPARLMLEITETAKIDDRQDTARVIDALHRRGIRVSIDDFGTGMASYDVLLELPFDELKIDRSFVRLITTNRKARLITKQLVAFARNARLHVVAEGVEDQATLSLLAQMQCITVQGFLISKPIEADAFLQLMQSQSRPAAQVG